MAGDYKGKEEVGVKLQYGIKKLQRKASATEKKYRPTFLPSDNKDLILKVKSGLLQHESYFYSLVYSYSP